MHNVHRGGHFKRAAKMTIYLPIGSDHTLKIIRTIANGTNRVAVKGLRPAMDILSTRRRRVSITQSEILSERPDGTSTKHHYAHEHHSNIIAGHMFR